MSRRASLPGAEELFRRTSTSERARESREESKESKQVDKSPKLQVAPPEDPAPGSPKKPRHQEKITFYCTSDDLMAIESTRLKLRAEFGLAADRGRIVRAALGYVLEDFEARGEDAILVRRLSE